MRFEENTALTGEVEMIIDYLDGTRKIVGYDEIPNTVLRHGRQALAKSLANKIGTSFNYYVTRMLFGDGGTYNGVKKYVDQTRNGLFGTTRLSKPVLANIDSTTPTQVTFTSVIGFDEVVGVVLNEMALQMSNGDVYSMTTFPDLTKTAEMQINFNWKLSFL
jgi:hypothetical protein